MAACYAAGQNDRAERVLKAMPARQQGGGFQKGARDHMERRDLRLRRLFVRQLFLPPLSSAILYPCQGRSLRLAVSL